MSTGILGYVATTGRGEVVACARLHRLFDIVDDHARSGGDQPMIYVPLQDSRNKCIGVMHIVGVERDAGFAEAEIEVFDGLKKFVEDGMQRCLLMESGRSRIHLLRGNGCSS